MPEGLGISFAPTNNEDARKAVGGAPLQEAIQTIALRLPRVVGARSPIPQGLLAAGPGSGLGNSVVQSILASLLGPQAGQPQGLQPTLGAPVSPIQQAVQGFLPRGQQQAYGPGMPPPPPSMPGPSVPPPRWTPIEGEGGPPPPEPPLPPPTGQVPRIPRSGDVVPGPQQPPGYGDLNRLFPPTAPPSGPSLASFPQDPRTDWPSLNWGGRY